ncbi:hypothetical protein N7463_007980 [Penicillium fimorum]|uniref:Uncharacterized protein n=1 Tax=Penicillium fimorum TaxID=1882269 RepID=A0A9W9XY60_9EURO|nr:hypothetical protein N7463_007980 [Penicillium fimorum]
MRLIFQLLRIFPAVLSQVISNPKPEPFTDFVNYVFWYPAADAVQWHTLYARALQLPDESLLITWENYPLEPPLFNYSVMEDQMNGWGMRFQPFLYTLPEKFGGYAAGSVLAAGVSTPFSLAGGVYIDLYVSIDNAKSWKFLSHVAYGAGPETIKNGDDAIWEPFLMFYEGKIVCFFSDQRDPAHSQKLIHVTTTDLLTWSADVPDVVYPTQGDRPGMTTIAPSPLEFDSVAGIPLVSNDTHPITPYGSPYVIWTPNSNLQDGSGLIILSAGNQEVVYVGEDAADADGWKTVDTGMWSAYSRSMRIVTIEGVKKLLFANGGNMGDPDNNSIACGVVEIPV